MKYLDQTLYIKPKVIDIARLIDKAITVDSRVTKTRPNPTGLEFQNRYTIGAVGELAFVEALMKHVGYFAYYLRVDGKSCKADFSVKRSGVKTYVDVKTRVKNLDYMHYTNHYYKQGTQVSTEDRFYYGLKCAYYIPLYWKQPEGTVNYGLWTHKSKFLGKSIERPSELSEPAFIFKNEEMRSIQDLFNALDKEETDDMWLKQYQGEGSQACDYDQFLTLLLDCLKGRHETMTFKFHKGRVRMENFVDIDNGGKR